MTADPSRPLLGLFVLLGGALALVCAVPLVLVLASFVPASGVPADTGMLLAAIPAAGVAVWLFVFVRRAAADLLLPSPVLSIAGDAVFDRRVSDTPIAWTDVAEAISLIDGRGGVLLVLRSPIATRADPFRPGTMSFERPEPGLAHIPVRAMNRPASVLGAAILEHAAAHGATTGEAASDGRMRRRGLFGRSDD